MAKRGRPQGSKNITKRGPGRPGRDWEAAFHQWLKSGKPKGEFLRTLGIKHMGGNVQRATHDWVSRARELVDGGLKAVKAVQAENRNGRGQTAETPTMVMPTRAQAAAGAKAASQGHDVRTCEVMPGESAYALLMKWREGQSVDDWQTADQLKSHIKAKIGNALRREAYTDPLTGEVKTITVSDLTTLEIRQMVEALNAIQRTQRLALGLSTENLGVQAPVAADSGVVKEKGKGPLFIVEMEGGKFTSPRPKRVS